MNSKGISKSAFENVAALYGVPVDHVLKDPIENKNNNNINTQAQNGEDLNQDPSFIRNDDSNDNDIEIKISDEESNPTFDKFNKKENFDTENKLKADEFSWNKGNVAKAILGVGPFNLIKAVAFAILSVPVVIAVELTHFVWNVSKATVEVILLAITSIFFHVWVDTINDLKDAQNNPDDYNGFTLDIRNSIKCNNPLEYDRSEPTENFIAYLKHEKTPHLPKNDNWDYHWNENNDKLTWTSLAKYPLVLGCNAFKILAVVITKVPVVAVVEASYAIAHVARAIIPRAFCGIVYVIPDTIDDFESRRGPNLGVRYTYFGTHQLITVGKTTSAEQSVKEFWNYLIGPASEVNQYEEF